MNSNSSPLKILLTAVLLLTLVKLDTAPAAPATPATAPPTSADGATPNAKTPDSHIIASDGIDEVNCNIKFLVSLGLQGRVEPKDTTLEMCSGVKKSCCRHSDQLIILDNLVKNNEMSQLSMLLDDMSGVYNRMLSILLQVSERIVTIYPLVKDRKKSNAKILMNRMMQFDIKKVEGDIRKSITGMHTFFKDTYKGLYCAACDAANQKFIDSRGNKFIYSDKFCRAIVVNSLHFLLYFHVYFGKFLNLNVRFLTSVGNSGKYVDRVIRNAPSFGTNQILFEKLNACRKYRNEGYWKDYCEDICSEFQVTKFNDFFAPNLKKIDRFNKFVARRLLKLKVRAAKKAAKGDDKKGAKGDKDGKPPAAAPAKSRRRLKDATPPADAKKDGDNAKKPAADGNAPPAEEGEKPAGPMTLDELEGHLVEVLNFEKDRTIFISSLGTDMDLENYTSKFKEEGMDLQQYGQMTVVDKENTKIIIKAEEFKEEKAAAKTLTEAKAVKEGVNLMNVWAALTVCLITLLLK